MKVYVVWHSSYERILGVYSTPELAQAVCEKSIAKDESQGMDCSIYHAEWEEWEIDALPEGRMII